MSAKSLLDRLRDREAKALADFLQERRPALLAYIERHMGGAVRQKVDPQDIFQEVSLAALKALPDTDFTQGDPFSWLCELAEHRIIDAQRAFVEAQKRAAGRERPLDAPVSADSSKRLVDLLIASMTTASQAFSKDQRLIRIQSAMQDLPAENREALRLRYVQGLETKDIAKRLRKSDGAVRVMLSRSIQRLQQLLD